MQPTARKWSDGSRLAAVMGPVVIVVGVLLALRGFLLGDLVPHQFEVRGEWLTNLCFMGRTLRGGHIPLWNAHVLGGTPFAADPIHGWMNLPAMATMTALPCAAGFTAYLALQPILAGLGIWWFLRSEGLSRVPAALGGVAMALSLVGSQGFALPWTSGALAWTTLLLAAASRLVRCERWSARLLWLGLAAVAWGQVAAAHFSDGLVVGTGALLFFLLPRFVADVRAGVRPARQAVMILALLMAAMVLVNLAYLAPRLANFRDFELSLGYARLDLLSRQLTGHGAGAVQHPTLLARWPLSFALSPGLHLGAVTLALAFGGWAGGRHRVLFGSLSAFGALAFVLSLPAVARAMPTGLQSSVVGGAYLHDPSRLYTGLYLALPIVGAVGLQAWLEAEAWARRLLIVLPGAVVWGLLPVLFGAAWSNLALFVMAGAAGAIALLAAARREVLAPLVVAVLAAELLVNARPVIFPPPRHGAVRARPSVRVLDLIRWEERGLADFLDPNPIATALGDRMVRTGAAARYLTVKPPGYPLLGFFGRDNFLGSQQSMLFGLEEAQGYNTVQLLRYWQFVRAADAPKNVRYAADYFKQPSPQVFDLLGVAWVVGPSRSPPPFVTPNPIVVDGEAALYAVPDPPPMVTVHPSWEVFGSSGAALRRVTEGADFDARTDLVVEGNPGISPAPSGASPGVATYWPRGPQAARITVDTSAPAIVLVRTTFDRHWRATVDGTPAPGLPADYVDQGIPVGPGRHVIELAYVDRSVGVGLLGSAVAVMALAAAAVLARRRERARFPSVGEPA